jgi:GT2 family glycosyltransferase
MPGHGESPQASLQRGVMKLAVIVVSHNSGRWLPDCLTSVLAHTGGVELDGVVVDAGSEDSTADIVGRYRPFRLVECENRGFAYANNRGAETTDAPWLLFLNPDTDVVEGTLSDLVRAGCEYPKAGIFGVKQVSGEGRIEPSMRRFPQPLRWLFEALGSERWGVDASWLGERILDPARYERPAQCDWTSGSAMLVRRETFQATNGMDERFFLYCEEPDLSLRALQAGWSTQYLPSITIVHYGGNESSSSNLAAQLAWARRRYMRKHFSRAGQAFGVAALALGYALRILFRKRPAQSRAGLEAMLGLRTPEIPPLDSTAQSSYGSD